MRKTNPTDIETLMDEYTAFWNGDFPKRDCVADSVEVYHDAAPDGVVRGRDALEAFVRGFHTAFPDFELVVDEWISSDGVVMKEWTMQGTHEAEFNGIPPTGREIMSRGMAKVLIDDGEVTEDRLYYNPEVMAEQLGLSER